MWREGFCQACEVPSKPWRGPGRERRKAELLGFGGEKQKTSQVLLAVVKVAQS